MAGLHRLGSCVHAHPEDSKFWKEKGRGLWKGFSCTHGERPLLTSERCPHLSGLRSLRHHSLSGSNLQGRRCLLQRGSREGGCAQTYTGVWTALTARKQRPACLLGDSSAIWSSQECRPLLLLGPGVIVGYRCWGFAVCKRITSCAAHALKCSS